jgi:flagellar biosynthesis protein FliQ
MKLKGRLGKPNISITIVSIWLLVIIAPIPFLSNLLIAEEGFFAILAVNNGKTKPNDPGKVLLVSRIQGENTWIAPRHPILPYWIMLKVLRPFSKPGDFDGLTLKEKTIRARVPFYSLYVLAWLLLLFTGFRMFTVKSLRNLIFPLGTIAFIGTWRVLVGGAISTYYDGNIGVLLVAICALGLCFMHSVKRFPLQILLGFICGFIAALGKNEWALAFLGAVLASAIVRIIYLRLTGTNDTIGSKYIRNFTFSLISGVILGSAFHYLLDPFNYLHGFTVMYDFSIKESYSWIDALMQRLPWLAPLVVLIIINLFLALHSIRNLLTHHFPQVVLLFWGIILFCGFMIPSHIADGFPRVFCPSFFALLAFFICRVKYWARAAQLPFIIIGILFFLFTIHNLNHIYKYHTRKMAFGFCNGKSLPALTLKFKTRYETFLRIGEVRKQDAALAYYFPDMDFIDNWGNAPKQRK